MYAKQSLNLLDDKIFLVLIGFCFLLPNIHVAYLSNQAVIPREFFVYAFSTFFVFILTRAAAVKYNTFYILAFAFSALQFFSLLWTSDLASGIEESSNYYFFLICSFALFQINTPRKKYILLITLLAAISISAFIGILQNFFVNSPLIFQASPPASTYVNKNMAASACILLLPLSLFMLFMAEKRAHKLLLAIANTLLLSFVLVSHTKGVWLAGIFILLSVIYILHLNKTRHWMKLSILDKKFYLAGIVAISAIIFLLPGVRNTDTALSPKYDPTQSIKVRLGMYQDALPLIAENPIFGIGSGGFRKDFRSIPGGPYAAQHAERDMYTTRLHNDHLQYLVEQGFVGFTIWALMLYLLYRERMSYLFSEKTDPKYKPIVFATLLGLTGMLIHAFFSFPIRIASTGGLFWICAGLALSYSHENREERTVRLNSRRRQLLLLFHLALSVFTVFLVTERAIGSYHLQQAEDVMFSNGRCNLARQHLDRSIAAAGYNVRLAHIESIFYEACRKRPPNEIAQAMSNILKYDPNHSRALLIMGKLSYALGRYDDATLFFSKALLVNPSSEDAIEGLNKSRRKRRNAGHADGMPDNASTTNPGP